MKKTLLASMLAATTLVSGYAQAEWSANVAATSNYLWRGLEQTDGAAAVSGGLDYAGESGFYAGAWASNATWGDNMETELDLYFGYSAGALDIGFIYYGYPDADGDPDFSEIYANYSFDALTLGIAVLADADGADFGDSIYFSADYAFAVGKDAEVALHAGYYDGDFVGDDASIDLGISISKDGFTFGASKLASDDNGFDDDLKVYASYGVDFEL